MTRDEVYESDRGERAYYESVSSLKQRMKLPLTKDGCEAILEQVSGALDLPLDDTMRQDFAGYVHHTTMNENTFTYGELGKVFWNRYSKTATWRLDQEAKERIAEAKAQAKLNEEAPKKDEPNVLTIAKDVNEASQGTPDVQ